MPESPPIALLDDDPEFLGMLAAQVSALGYAVRSFRSVQDFFTAAASERFGCLIVDHQMPEMSGLEVVSALNRSNQAIPVIMVTGFADIPTSVAVLRGGAVDLLEKPVTPEAIGSAIVQALERHHAITADEREDAVRIERLGRLTPRETEVLKLVIGGHQTKSIAAILEISPRTVEIHRAHVMHKLEVRTLPELIQFGLGLRPPADLSAKPTSSRTPPRPLRRN